MCPDHKTRKKDCWQCVRDLDRRALAGRVFYKKKDKKPHRLDSIVINGEKK